MQIDDNTTFDEFLGKKKPDPNKQRRFRIILLVMFIVVVLISLITMVEKTNVVNVLKGTGTITGIVVDQNGQPFHGDIFILGTDLDVKTDENGRFEISNVPTGPQTLIVADEYVGLEYAVQVGNASHIQMGKIQFQTTKIAPP